MTTRRAFISLLALSLFVMALSTAATAQETSEVELISMESVAGDGVWVSPNIERIAQARRRIQVKVWFDKQLLGDGAAYARRAKEFAGAKRRELRASAIQSLQKAADASYDAAKEDLQKLLDDGVISGLQRHWVINGFTCMTTADGVPKLKDVPGVKKIFAARGGGFGGAGGANSQKAAAASEQPKFDPDQYKHPWYIRSLQADRVWKKWGVTGKGTLNVIHDGNFLFSKNLSANAYRNPNEIPDNDKDDDNNGYVDDVHGFNFQRNTNQLTTRPVPPGGFNPQAMHGTMCAAIICGPGTKESPFEFGVAPEARWAGVIAGVNLEQSVEWAILQGADTYSMSFSIPGLGEYRSHWRKVLEHGSFCGVYFVSGAGNFAQNQPVPVQMRVPEDIPEVVFAAAGVQRDFSRTPFSSKGPVEWKTEHYQDGKVQKPEVCAFNMGLPLQLTNGRVLGNGLNGNSFAGPMFCGSIALMVSADPDLLPWDLKEIITSTATDVAAPGVDYETGHGLINCYRAVKEVLRRKAVREGKDAAEFTGREPGDELDIPALSKKLSQRRVVIARVQPRSAGAQAGVKPGDIVISLDGKKIASSNEFIAIRRNNAQRTLKLVLKRGDKETEYEVKPGSFGLALSATFAEPVFE